MQFKQHQPNSFCLKYEERSDNYYSEPSWRINKINFLFISPWSSSNCFSSPTLHSDELNELNMKTCNVLLQWGIYFSAIVWIQHLNSVLLLNKKNPGLCKLFNFNLHSLMFVFWRLTKTKLFRKHPRQKDNQLKIKIIFSQSKDCLLQWSTHPGHIS